MSRRGTRRLTSRHLRHPASQVTFVAIILNQFDQQTLLKQDMQNMEMQS